MTQKPNALINESSPYLLQHAYNPVEWNPWNEGVLQRAKDENKLMLISVGYSACHWCHVMEKESFEDEQVARIMNDNFICIKVDREERPDIDQVYMLAVQLMTGRGGWPLNCFALPDGKAVYGGTYFPKQQWINILLNLTDLWQNEKDKVYEYADRLMQGMQLSDPVMSRTEGFDSTEIAEAVNQWYKRCDHKEGGPNHAPKFMLPANYIFLQHYNWYRKDSAIKAHIDLTLKKMAFGGIYDQIRGGFARYSTDMDWKVPHFEKMLYDNAQLVSLYSRGYSLTGNILYKEIVEQTLEFISMELKGNKGQFFSALDADSEGEEGKFYVWKKEELQEILGEDLRIAEAFYNINDKGLWEHGNYILLRNEEDSEVAEKLGMDVEALKSKISGINEILIRKRNTRTRPGLDDKTLCSWNAMMCTAYCDAYKAFRKSEHLETAVSNMEFILSNMKNGEGLYHSWKKDKPSINGFLEDYAFVCQALIDLYECTFDERYLEESKRFAGYVVDHFSDKNSPMFWFTSDLDPALVVRKKELSDNVIPSSNSVMAMVLFRLGHYFSDDDLISRSEAMAKNIYNAFLDYPEGYGNWGQVILSILHPFYEVGITGEGKHVAAKELNRRPLPRKAISVSNTNTILPFMSDKKEEEKLQIFICSGKTCQAPVDQTDKALTMLV